MKSIFNPLCAALLLGLCMVGCQNELNTRGRTDYLQPSAVTGRVAQARAESQPAADQRKAERIKKQQQREAARAERAKRYREEQAEMQQKREAAMAERAERLREKRTKTQQAKTQQAAAPRGQNRWGAPDYGPPKIDSSLRRRILALNPEHVSQSDVDRVLSKTSAPQVINLHGGIYPVHLVMKDFGRFLTAMGYPRQNARLPGGEYSYSPYLASDKIAGAIAWYYEQTRLPVLMVGHSQGGMQLMKVLHEIDGTFGNRSATKPWNPVTRQFEERTLFRDPRRGRQVSMKELRPVLWAAGVASGGAAKAMPNQWIVSDLVRKVPNATRYFTGYYVPGDILGGGAAGPVGINEYRTTGSAKVRNFVVSYGSEHVTIPRTNHLAKNAASRTWISSYHPSRGQELPADYAGPRNNILWAADVWYEVKKHWCIAMQEYVRRRG